MVNLWMLMLLMVCSSNVTSLYCGEGDDEGEVIFDEEEDVAQEEATPQPQAPAQQQPVSAQATPTQPVVTTPINQSQPQKNGAQQAAAPAQQPVPAVQPSQPTQQTPTQQASSQPQAPAQQPQTSDTTQTQPAQEQDKQEEQKEEATQPKEPQEVQEEKAAEQPQQPAIATTQATISAAQSSSVDKQPSLPVQSSAMQPTPMQPVLQPSPMAQVPVQQPAMPTMQAQIQPKPVQQSSGEGVTKSDTKPLPPVSEGFDTVNISEPSGNWLYKRIWWERAQKRYDLIQQVMTKIFEARTPLVNKRIEADQNIFEPLLFNTGLSQGELTVILDDLMQEINRVKDLQGGELTDEQKEFLKTIAVHQKTLEQLQEDIQKINKIENELDEDLKQLDAQLARAQNFERQAWEHFKTIAQELSDAKARQLYYTIETIEKSLTDILAYIATPLSQHFEQLLKLAQDQAAQVTATITSLKEKGIDFKQHAEQMEKQAADKQRELFDKEKQHAVDQAREETEQEYSWTSRIKGVWHAITGAFSSAWQAVAGGVSSAYNWVVGLFKGSASEDQEEPKMLPAEIQTKEE